MFAAGLYAHISTTDQLTLALPNWATQENATPLGWAIAL
jgi:hypothetical protein